MSLKWNWSFNLVIVCPCFLTCLAHLQANICIIILTKTERAKEETTNIYPVSLVSAKHINKGKKDKECKLNWTRNNKTLGYNSRWELTEGRIGNDVALLFQPPLLHRKGLVVTDELIHHTHHSADSCHCHSSTPTLRFIHLTACANTFQASCSPLLTWKHNHTHTCTRTETNKVSYLSGSAYLCWYCTHVFAPSQTHGGIPRG